MARNSVQRGKGGRLWFATSNGSIYINPASINDFVRSVPAPVLSFAADGRGRRQGDELGPEIHDLFIRYFALDLPNPKEVIYRYRLLGAETKWTFAGNRTEAKYTNLRPGKYLFQVVASNGSGLWDTDLASMDFRVLPHYWQTWWFDALCIAAALAVVLTIFKVRLSSATKLVSLRAGERADERIRMARDLHDTLLQGLHGLLMSFHVAAQAVGPEHKARKQLDRALQIADQLISEGRNRVQNLRSEGVMSKPLDCLIAETAEIFQVASGVPCTLEVSGKQRRLEPAVEQETFYIVKEALTNAYQHSQATRIDTNMSYSRRRLSVTCLDKDQS